MIEYEIELSADLGNVLAPVGELVNELNASLAESGVDEKLALRARPFRCTVTSPHELTQEDQDKMKQIITEQFHVMQPAWRVKVESFRRKSGNVQQSAA